MSDPDIIEIYKNDRDYPTHYRCIKCGSEFPTIGDTDQWKHCQPHATGSRVAVGQRWADRDHRERGRTGLVIEVHPDRARLDWGANRTFVRLDRLVKRFELVRDVD